MCGIAGGWWSDPEAFVDERMQRALYKLRHRGPNDQGVERYHSRNGLVCFGHTRLSVIDLSAGGHQPMNSVDGRFAIVFNGEIYNYRELRAELVAEGHHFRSDSDTEVLLASWTRWGNAVVKRLIGMYAFVVFDRFEGTISCLRDPFGIKPFFYCSQKDAFVFGSEIAAVNELRGGLPELDWQKAYDYLAAGDYDAGDRTFFKGVKHLLPGCMITLDHPGQDPVVERWWWPEIQERWQGSFADAAARLREMFLQSVRLHLRSDVPLGAALSGGLDSSSVVCAMRHLEPDAEINTFSFVAEGYEISEESWVDRVVADTTARSFKIRATGAELARDLDDMIRIQGEPFGSTSIYAQYRVFQLASENGITVTLDGQGADELLAGYHGYPGARMHSLVDRHEFIQAVRFLRNWADWPGRSITGGVARLVNEMSAGTLNRTLKRLAGGEREFPVWLHKGMLAEAGVRPSGAIAPCADDAQDRRLMAALREALSVRGLPALLRHADRNSMRFSVESRVPFLTSEMTEFVLSLPENYLVSDHGETKSVFRAAMRGIVPDEILDRRDKIGFSTPEKDWLLGMSDTVRAWLKAGCDAPFIDWNIILRHFDAIENGKQRFSWQVWRWINFARWHRATFEG